MAVDEYGLTPRQRAWCDYYLECGQATEAARKAGYKNPEQSGKDNTRKQPCKQYIAVRMERKNSHRIASADEVLQFFSDTMNGKIKDQFGLDASLQDRIKAGQELMKRYAVADDRQRSTMARLDAIIGAFQLAVTAAPDPAEGGTPPPPAEAPAEAGEGHVSSPEGAPEGGQLPQGGQPTP